VKAHIIAPGRMLVTAQTDCRQKADPVMEAFLAFIAQDMEDHPEKIKPLSASRAKRIAELTKGVVVDLDEDLGDEALI
jgi:antitoxin PrlF